MTPHENLETNSAAALPLKSRCRFCQTTDGKRSNEHVLRRKFKKLMWTFPDTMYTYVENGMMQTSRKVPASAFDVRVNEVCKECNEGWLEDLEDAVEPMLLSLARGKEATWKDDDWATLALWMTVRCMLRTLTDPEQNRAPKYLFQQVYKQRQIPDGFMVLWARPAGYFLPGGRNMMRWHKKPGHKPGDRPNGFDSVVSYGFSRLYFQVYMCSGSRASKAETVRNAHYVVARNPDAWMMIHPEVTETPAPDSYLDEQEALTASAAPQRQNPKLNVWGIEQAHGPFGERLR